MKLVLESERILQFRELGFYTWNARPEKHMCVHILFIVGSAQPPLSVTYSVKGFERRCACRLVTADLQLRSTIIP